MFKNILFACTLGLLAVILGAFGTHALQETLTEPSLRSYETGVRYQMYHALLLLFINNFSAFTDKQKNTISLFIFVGILLFSGSIYVMQLTTITAKSIWFITPLGGLCLIMGWLLIIINLIKKTIKN